jgi:hypothetical protein
VSAPARRPDVSKRKPTRRDLLIVIGRLQTLIFRAAKEYGYVERTSRYPNLYAAERFLERQIDDTIGW